MNMVTLHVSSHFTMPAPSAIFLGARRQKAKLEHGCDTEDQSDASDASDAGHGDGPTRPAYKTRNKKTTAGTTVRPIMEEVARLASAKNIETVLPAFDNRVRRSYTKFSADLELYCARNNVAYHVRTSLKVDAKNRCVYCILSLS
jgi:hypothetical protein